MKVRVQAGANPETEEMRLDYMKYAIVIEKLPGSIGLRP
jgi:hypothetical protein